MEKSILWSGQYLNERKGCEGTALETTQMVVTTTEPPESHHISSVNFTFPNVALSESVCMVAETRGAVSKAAPQQAAE